MTDLGLLIIAEGLGRVMWIALSASIEREKYGGALLMLKLCLDTITVRPKGNHDQS